MKVTIDITPDELERIKNLLWKRAAMVKCGMAYKTLEDKILFRIFEAAQDGSTTKEKED